MFDSSYFILFHKAINYCDCYIFYDNRLIILNFMSEVLLDSRCISVAGDQDEGAYVS